MVPLRLGRKMFLPSPDRVYGTCLGATLARTEIAEALPILAQRLGPIEPDGQPVWRPALGITGPVSLPIRFTAPAGHPAITNVVVDRSKKKCHQTPRLI